MTDAHTSRGSRRSLRELPLAAVGGAAMVAWVIVEVAFRWGLAPVLADPLGSPRTGDMVSVAIGFTLLAAGIAWWGRRYGIEPTDWEYEVSVRAVATGFGGAVAWLVALIAFVLVYAAVAGMPDSNPTAAAVGAPDARWALAVLLLVNGVLVPITEELAWRGVIQTALMDSYGVLVGSALTATGFVLKHVIVDGGARPLRLASLVVLAVVFCGLRARWGTTSSTVAHLSANLYATGAVVLAAL